MKVVYVLMEDSWGSMFSCKYPTGVALIHEDQAKDFVNEDPHHRSYHRVTIYNNLLEAAKVQEGAK